ncbi:alpha/beta fold hydrolase [Maridesulfovibrio sp. FT414]|uniref:alpha/beta fold hydrolase n=1 Tax=Maridesulfovibrio sp. FT414 TaxID=2979469 RepID=UPI003D805A06
MKRMIPILLLGLLLCGCTARDYVQQAEYLAPLPVQHVRSGDITVGYRIFGKGEPLLMVMGFAGTMDIWDAELIRILAEKHTVITYDNRGIASTSAGVEKISISRMADDAAILLETLGYPKAHILGWSMGGLVAQELALTHPDKVDKLILLGTACDPIPVADITRRLIRMDTKELLSHFFPSGWMEKHPDALKELPRPSIAPDPKAVSAQAEAMLNWPGTCSSLQELQIDTLVISGTDDDILPEPLSMELVRRIDGSWLVRFRNATHWLMYQDPASLGQTVNTFLEVEENMME